MFTFIKSGVTSGQLQEATVLNSAPLQMRKPKQQGAYFTTTTTPTLHISQFLWEPSWLGFRLVVGCSFKTMKTAREATYCSQGTINLRMVSFFLFPSQPSNLPNSSLPLPRS